MSDAERDIEKEARKHKFTEWGLLPEDRSGGSDVIISSVMWDTPEPGQFMRYWPSVFNRGETPATALSLTAFFGFGALFEDPVEAYAQRDLDWPETTTPIFSLKAGERERIQLGHRIEADRSPGFYMVNAILWQRHIYSQPARIVARFHVQFQVKEKARAAKRKTARKP